MNKVFVLLAFIIPINQVRSYFWPTYVSDSQLGIYWKAAIATDAAPCAPIGRNIFKRNGSAVDAAIAVLLCVGVHNPQSTGLGGGFLMIYYNRTEQKAYYIDSRETAPRKATKDMFGGNASKALEGGLSMAIPGELAGYEEVHRRFGRLPWEELFIPTIQMCREGIVVSKHLARVLDIESKRLVHFENIRKVFLKNGIEPYKEGERIKLPVFAQALEKISREGKKALYGPSKMACEFLTDLKAAGSIIDSNDLQNYTPLMRKPFQIKLRNNITMYTTSVPGSGPILGFMLAVLDSYRDLNETVPRREEMATLAYHRILEILKFGYVHRSQLEDENSERMKELLSTLESPHYANHVRHLINDSVACPDQICLKGCFPEDHGTSHLSLVAPDGDAVSITSTINHHFGSRVYSPSTGIILNNQMDDFSSPNITGDFPLPPFNPNRIRPGRRPMSSMAPAIFVDSLGNVTFVVGASGGAMITTSVLQVVARVLFFGEGLKEGIDAPRIHYRRSPNDLIYEKNFPQVMVDNLRRFGHKIRSRSWLSVVAGILRDPHGYLYANSDYRKGGGTSGI